MDRSESVMEFIAGYSPQNSQMSPQALEELKSIMMTFLELEDNQQMVEFALQNMLESHRGLLERHGKPGLTRHRHAVRTKPQERPGSV
jgi:hypothetical protein